MYVWMLCRSLASTVFTYLLTHVTARRQKLFHFKGKNVTQVPRLTRKGGTEIKVQMG
jgi:hypothetical protein